MNPINQDFNCYTKGNQMFAQNYSMQQRQFYSPHIMSTDMQTGVPMFPLYGYDNNEDLDRDVSYMKQLYPKAVVQIQSEVDEECDKLEYDGSCMFDAYPDKTHLNMIIDSIYNKAIIRNNDSLLLETEDIHHPYFPCDRGNECPPPPRPDYLPQGDPDWLRGMIGVLLFNEMMNRRRRYRSRKRWF